jgi:hypothetical protein
MTYMRPLEIAFRSKSRLLLGAFQNLRIVLKRRLFALGLAGTRCNITRILTDG